MTVAELIARLQTMPPELPVWMLYDGWCKNETDHVWVTRAGDEVLLGKGGEQVYHDKNRPAGAPTEQEEQYWQLPNLRPDPYGWYT